MFVLALAFVETRSSTEIVITISSTVKKKAYFPAKIDTASDDIAIRFSAIEQNLLFAFIVLVYRTKLFVLIINRE